MWRIENVESSSSIQLACRFHSLAWICHQKCFKGFWSFSEDKENKICQDLSWEIAVSTNENKRAFRTVSHIWAFQQRCFSETPTENKISFRKASQSKKFKFLLMCFWFENRFWQNCGFLSFANWWWTKMKCKKWIENQSRLWSKRIRSMNFTVQKVSYALKQRLRIGHV